MGKILLILAASIAIFTAIAHLSCIPLGPQCYASQMAPPSIVDSAEQGTWLAPLGTIAVSAIFLIWAAYGLSGAGIIGKLPLLTLGNYTIAALCLIRGILGIQLWVRHPELVSTFANISNWIWFAVGLCFLLGYRYRPGRIDARS